MGRQAKKRHARRAHRALNARQEREDRECRLAIAQRLHEVGITAKVQAVRAVLLTPDFDAAFSAARTTADLGPAPPTDEEGVRAIALDVLHSPPFNVDTADVLLKVSVDQDAKRLALWCYPGVAAAMAATEHVRAQLEARKLSGAPTPAV